MQMNLLKLADRGSYNVCLSMHLRLNYNDDTKKTIFYYAWTGILHQDKNIYVVHMFYAWLFVNNTAVTISINKKE